MALNNGPIIALLSTLLIAGCASPAPESDGIVPAPIEEFSEVQLDGRLWFPPSAPMLGESTLEVEVPIEMNGTRLEAFVRKGVAPDAGLDRALASAMVKLVSPDDRIVGELMLSWDGAEEGIMEADGLGSGVHRLTATVYGASAEDQIGHFLDFSLSWGAHDEQI